MAKAKGTVTFNQDRCKGCGLCVNACPVKIMKIDTNVINKKGYNPSTVVDMDKCIGCASCATMCPDQVITVERD
ncbi:4Fe-4S dicluster domain-containing protein [Metaclostridioides mangenotii]|jgi:2-oxoglutarate ferredoxin oxidoreductase subunit delta|uniref:2-oxoglutarate ferredoxin oxidoreductase subunit delta n=1 Tax=Metaclostridioides mangenotii TaxID=1540 RepID=A0ABS4ECY6_9FIRM|nr:4Fe-4S dicluster domain-containing protein [Clostridioides mangenotii]MBP1855792.1 2-oxoglutarate ferredoxin oxidoreductase subunit delta [Clostridioides mangenotii]